MRYLGAIGVVLGAGALLTLVTVSCVGSDSNLPTETVTDAGTEGGGGQKTNCLATEQCGNKIDDNCNGQVDEDCGCAGVQEGSTRACGQNGPGICTVGTQACVNQMWTECNGIAAHAKEETCDGLDENCDGQIDEGLKITCVRDKDKDGYASTLPTDKMDFCPVPLGDGGSSCPDGYLRTSESKGNDCEENDNAIHPGAAEKCDAIDSDCDGKPRNGCPSSVETYGTLSESGVYGYNTLTPGCGTQTYASSSTTCTSGAALGLTGFAGGVQFSGPTQMALVCNDGLINETVGAPEYSYALLSNGANTTAPLAGAGRNDDSAGGANCPSGQWLVGLKHTHSCLFDRVTLICAPITYQRVGPTWTAVTGGVTTAFALGNAGSALTEFTYQCPSGSVMTSITEWHTTGTANDSNYISAFKIGCKPLGFTPQ